MTELEYCFPVTNATKKSKQFSGHFLSDFAVLCSIILSHPLYFSYFLFFSPYILKLLTFLSPLFITTTLLLLSLLTSIFHDTTSISNLLEDLRLRFHRIGDEEDEESKELRWVEEFEVFKIVFGFHAFDQAREYPDSQFSDYGKFFGCSEENPDEFSGKLEEEEEEEKVLGVLISDDGGLPVKCQESLVELSGKIEEEEERILGVLISSDEDFPAKRQENPDEFAGKRKEGERLEELSTQETPKCEKLKCGVGKAGEENSTVADKKCSKALTMANGKPLELTPSSFDGGNQTQQKPPIKTHSIGHGQALWDTNDGDNSSKKHDDYAYSSSESQPISPSLSNLGSMRKQKEWRRTLACKLFEERHNGGGGAGGGGEGMDLLWEAYERTDENWGKESNGVKKKKKEKEKRKKKGRVVDCVEDFEDGDEEEEEEGESGQLCCLQALKFSAGKMNFGMGRPGLLKISKAFKGIGVGWLNHHGHHHSGGSKKEKKF